MMEAAAGFIRGIDTVKIVIWIVPMYQDRRLRIWYMGIQFFAQGSHKID